MEALAISAANLDVIEDNLGQVANELSGVINNVNTMNQNVSNVEEKVNVLKDDIKSLVKEIRENTIINNARQNIIYNNSIIEKKFGYYDNVRRSTLSLIDVIFNSKVDKNSIKKLRDELLLNNPDYWLTNALSSLISWCLDDKELTYKELNNALIKNEEKTSLFFCIINLKLNRIDASIKWLSKYLSLIDRMHVSKDFITVLDLATTGIFPLDAKKIILTAIETWIKDLKSSKYVVKKSNKTWKEYIYNHQKEGPIFSYLEENSVDKGKIIYNSVLSTTYSEITNEFNEIINKNNKFITVDNILKNLIYDYEDVEEKYKKDNLKNNLIIELNGNREKALELFNAQEEIYSGNLDLLSLFNNVIINPNNFLVSPLTRKFILSIIKEDFLKAYEEVNNLIKLDEINFSINDFSSKTKDGSNKREIEEELNIFISNKYKKNDKNLFIMIVIINFIGLISLIFTMKNSLLLILTLLYLLGANIALIYKIYKERENEKALINKKKKEYNTLIEKILVDAVDYRNYINSSEEVYNNLVSFLSNITLEDFIKNNNERNINIER